MVRKPAHFAELNLDARTKLYGIGPLRRSKVHLRQLLAVSGIQLKCFEFCGVRRALPRYVEGFQPHLLPVEEPHADPAGRPWRRSAHLESRRKRGRGSLSLELWSSYTVLHRRRVRTPVCFLPHLSLHVSAKGCTRGGRFPWLCRFPSVRLAASRRRAWCRVRRWPAPGWCRPACGRRSRLPRRGARLRRARDAHACGLRLNEDTPLVDQRRCDSKASSESPSLTR